MKTINKFFIVVLLVFSVSILPAAADDSTVSGAEPYDEKSVPQWAKDLRRGEIITLGSWPFTVLLTSLGYSLIQVGKHNFDFSYMRNPFSTMGGDYNKSETMGIIFTSLGISAGIGLADFIVNVVKRNKAAKKNNSTQFENITITPIESEKDRILIFENQNSDLFFGNLESAVF